MSEITKGVVLGTIPKDDKNEKTGVVELTYEQKKKRAYEQKKKMCLRLAVNMLRLQPIFIYKCNKRRSPRIK